MPMHDFALTTILLIVVSVWNIETKEKSEGSESEEGAVANNEEIYYVTEEKMVRVQQREGSSSYYLNITFQVM